MQRKREIAAELATIRLIPHAGLTCRAQWKIAVLMTKPITPDQLRALLNNRRFEGERIADKRAIRRAAEEIERLRSELQAISERAAKALDVGEQS